MNASKITSLKERLIQAQSRLLELKSQSQKTVADIADKQIKINYLKDRIEQIKGGLGRSAGEFKPVLGAPVFSDLKVAVSSVIPAVDTRGILVIANALDRKYSEGVSLVNEQNSQEAITLMSDAMNKVGDAAPEALDFAKASKVIMCVNQWQKATKEQQCPMSISDALVKCDEVQSQADALQQCRHGLKESIAELNKLEHLKSQQAVEINSLLSSIQDLTEDVTRLQQEVSPGHTMSLPLAQDSDSNVTSVDPQSGEDEVTLDFANGVLADLGMSAGFEFTSQRSP